MASMLLPGFQDSADVRLGAVILNSYDVNGVAWVCTDIDGWWDMPDISLPDDPRPFEQDGSYYTPGRYMPRVLTLKGVLVPPPGILPGVTTFTNARDLASYARQAFGAALDLARNSTTLQVDEEVPKQCQVQMVGKPTFHNNNSNGMTAFTIPLKAGDPRKYAQTLTALSVAASASATNAGTYPTSAIMRIKGPVTNPTVTNIEASSSLQFNITVASGQYLEIDLLNRGVLLNGVTNKRSTMTIPSRWFMLQPGANTLVLTASSLGSGSGLEVDYRSAWLY